MCSVLVDVEDKKKAKPKPAVTKKPPSRSNAKPADKNTIKDSLLKTPPKSKSTAKTIPQSPSYTPIKKSSNVTPSKKPVSPVKTPIKSAKVINKKDLFIHSPNASILLSPRSASISKSRKIDNAVIEESISLKQQLSTSRQSRSAVKKSAEKNSSETDKQMSPVPNMPKSSTPKKPAVKSTAKSKQMLHFAVGSNSPKSKETLTVPEDDETYDGAPISVVERQLGIMSLFYQSKKKQQANKSEQYDSAVAGSSSEYNYPPIDFGMESKSNSHVLI